MDHEKLGSKDESHQARNGAEPRITLTLSEINAIINTLADIPHKFGPILDRVNAFFVQKLNAAKESSNASDTTKSGLPD